MGDCPGASAVTGVFDKIDEAPRLVSREARRVLRGPKKSAVVSAAKRIKAEGGEPTYPAMAVACPKALINPDTEEPVDKEGCVRGVSGELLRRGPQPTLD